MLYVAHPLRCRTHYCRSPSPLGSNSVADPFEHTAGQTIWFITSKCRTHSGALHIRLRFVVSFPSDISHRPQNTHNLQELYMGDSIQIVQLNTAHVHKNYSWELIPELRLWKCLVWAHAAWQWSVAFDEGPHCLGPRSIVNYVCLTSRGNFAKFGRDEGRCFASG